MRRKEARRQDGQPARSANLQRRKQWPAQKNESQHPTAAWPAGRKDETRLFDGKEKACIGNPKGTPPGAAPGCQVADHHDEMIWANPSKTKTISRMRRIDLPPNSTFRIGNRSSTEGECLTNDVIVMFTPQTIGLVISSALLQGSRLLARPATETFAPRHPGDHSQITRG